MELSVTALTDKDCGAWNEFVRAREDSTFFHLAEWRAVVRDSCGFAPHYLIASNGGEIHGVLPLFHIKSRLFGRNLVSTPFCVVGGPLGTGDAVRKLVDAAVHLAERLEVDCLELRNRAEMNATWQTVDTYATFTRAIDPDPDVNLKAIPRKQRAMVRKGIKAGLRSEVNQSLDPFFSDLLDQRTKSRHTSIPQSLFSEIVQCVFTGHRDHDGICGRCAGEQRDEFHLQRHDPALLRRRLTERTHCEGLRLYVLGGDAPRRRRWCL